MPQLLIVHGRIATMRDGRYSLVEDGAIHARDGTIEWVGPTDELSLGLLHRDCDVIDAHGALVTPGLIDCHTHLVYAGDRAREFEMRQAGATYEDIARAGGGILSTVKATRAASNADLRAQSSVRLRELIASGVTTVEIKSGYGLDVENELRCLRIARSLCADHAVSVVTTLLGAHSLPPEFAGKPDEYITAVCEEMIPRAAREGLATAVDGFCERIAFNTAQIARVFEAAQRHGLRVKLHAEQLSDSGGARLAARFNALSADHLEHASKEGVAALAKAGTVAVLLPGAYYFLREKHLPPVDLLRRHGVKMAVATDCNPGTSPCTSLTTVMNMACVLFALSPEEALAGATCHAAAALGFDDRGVIDIGKRADLAIWEGSDPARVAWQIAGQQPRHVVFDGRLRQ
jgi:imidazolonepropionase